MTKGPASSRLPTAFKRTRRSLEVLNIGSVGFALAAATAAIIGGTFTHTNDPATAVSLATGVPTIFIGALWAWMLRRQKRVQIGSWQPRLGWLLAIPLAMLNAGLALGGIIVSEDSASLSGFGLGMIVGATFGAIIWIPALLLTILCFGAPIAWAERQAERGLSGRERGEFVVGSASAIIATLALLIARAENPFASALGAVGLVSASLAITESFRRLRARRRFITDVEAGRVNHFRIDPTPEGRALVRIVSQGEDYRVADYEEEVAALDDEGNVTVTHLR